MQLKFVSKNPVVTRLDQFLLEEFKVLDGYGFLTRSQIQKLIKNEQISVNGVCITKTGFNVELNDSVICDSGDQNSFDILLPSYEIKPYELNLKILYEDNDIIVIDKSPGLTVHPGAGNRDKTLVNALVHYYKVKGDGIGLEFIADNSKTEKQRPGIVHRLDKDTSGVIVVTKNLLAQQSLSKQFFKRTTKRKYIALVLGSPRKVRNIEIKEQGIIDAPIGRHNGLKTKMSVVEGGRSAVTYWSTIQRFKHAVLIEAELKTGRTHQIRVHFAHIGSPLIGDSVYTSDFVLPNALQRVANDFGRQALHAGFLGFSHPRTGEEMEFHSPLPDDFQKLIKEFEKE